ncbi:MAG: formylglycine-generating enzyme family protein [Treponema sp.]|nr:formylglycine-generating enzyme family protein [Treponema sp.]
MKRIKIKHFCLLFIFTSLILLNCRNIFLINNPNEDNPSKILAGNVRISIFNSMDETEARTLFPMTTSNDFSSYKISFNPKNKKEPIDDIYIYEAPFVIDVDLEEGEWEIIVYGRINFQGKEEIIAEGKEIINVIANENINVSITIRSVPINGENGMFMWSLVIPNDVEALFWTLKLTEWNNESNKVIERYREEINNQDVITGSGLCKSGYYLLHVIVGTDRQEISYFTVVHIRDFETTLFEKQVNHDEFVSVIKINGSVNLDSIRINEINIFNSFIQLKEVWAYSSLGQRIGYANIINNNWEMRIIEPNEIIELTFYVYTVISLGNNIYELELKTDIIEQVFKDDLTLNRILNIDRNLLRLEGTLNLYGNNLLRNNWKVNVSSSDKPSLSLHRNAVETDNNGRWAVIIDSFPELTSVYFSVENEINKKYYKRNDFNSIELKNTGNDNIVLNAYFSPPSQVWLQGDMFTDNTERAMQGYNGSFTYTRNSTANEQSQYIFNIIAKFEPGGKIVNYGFSKIVSDTAGLLLFDNNDKIAWENDLFFEGRPAVKGNVKISISFSNDEYFDERAAPVIKLERINEVFISGGSFIMGSPEGEAGRLGPSGKSSEVPHSVNLKSFYMMPVVVTQGLYEDMMPVPAYTGGANFRNGNYPVVNITWWDALAFANKLSKRDGLEPVYPESAITSRNITNNNVNWNATGWRLPTEAEWEYACRAGNAGAFAFFRDVNGVVLNVDQNGKVFLNNNFANYDGLKQDAYFNPGGISLGRIIDVDSYRPNDWGLYNMHGNVWEFCWDWFGNYTIPAQPDPKGPINGTINISTQGPRNNPIDFRVNSINRRIIRGGSYFNSASSLRSAHRGILDPLNANYNDIGFRLVRRGDLYE